MQKIMISFFAFSGLLNFIFSFFLGILVYLKGRKQFQSRSFALYFFSVAFWSFGYYFWQISSEEHLALFWSRFLMVGAIFIPIFYFHFIVSFLDLAKRYKKFLYAGYGLSFLFLFLNFTPYFIKGVKAKLFFPFWPEPGIFYFLFLLMFFGLVCCGWYLLIKALKKTKEKIKRQQIKYFLLGTGIGFVGGATNYFLWYDIPILPYGNILIIFGVLFVALAITRYHLFEVKVILTELLVGAMGVALFVLPFLIPTTSLRIFTIAAFLLFCIFAYYLIKATHQESRRREEAELLAVREKALRKNAEKLTNEIKQLDRAKTEFMMHTSHQLRTPLTIIKGYISMILEEEKELSEETKKKLKNILSSCERFIRIVNSILDLFRLESGVIKYEFQEKNIKKIIKSVVEELKPRAKEKNLYLTFKESKEKIPLLLMDEDKIRQAISKVIDNAIGYTQKGGIEIKCQVRNECCQVLIKDSGVGLLKEEKETIFKSFIRGSDSIGLNPEGIGLGLYFAKKLIKGNQGEIWIESEGKGKGSTFYIELPIK